MTFCDNCGSYLKKTADGFKCPRCGRLFPSKLQDEPRQDIRRSKDANSVYVVEKPREHRAIVVQSCPKCGNREAFRWVSSISGEHAGVRRERTVEHFQCVKCHHTWAKSA